MVQGIARQHFYTAFFFTLDRSRLARGFPEALERVESGITLWFH